MQTKRQMELEQRYQRIQDVHDSKAEMKRLQAEQEWETRCMQEERARRRTLAQQAAAQRKRHARWEKRARENEYLAWELEVVDFWLKQRKNKVALEAVQQDAAHK